MGTAESGMIHERFYRDRGFGVTTKAGTRSECVKAGEHAARSVDTLYHIGGIT